MPLDPQVKVLLDMMKGMPSFSELSPAAARKQTSEMRAMRNATPPVVANVENRKIPGPAGSIRFVYTRPRARVRSRCWFITMAADL